MSKFSQDIKTVPNILSLARILILAAGTVFYFNGYILTGIAFGIVGGCTDYLDGYIARRTNQVTYLGAILDQFSDLVMETLFIIMVISHPKGFHPAWMTVYLFREFWVGTIRRFMIAHQLDIKSSFIGKLKTNFISWSFVFWFAYIGEIYPPWDPFFVFIGSVGLYGGLFWGYLSGWMYTRQFIAGYNTLDTAN